MAPKAKPAAAKAAAAKPEAKAKPAAKKKEPKEDRPEDLIPKVEPPNEAEYDTAYQAITKAIEELQVEKKEVDAKIKDRSGGKDEYHTERQALKDELQKWSAQFDSKKQEKEELNRQMGDKKLEYSQQKESLNKLKKAMPYGNEEEINKRIAEVEFKMQTEHMPLKEEKKLLSEIQELKRNRPKVHQLINLEQAIHSDDKVLPLREQMSVIVVAMKDLYQKKKEVSEKLKELNESRTKTTGDLPELIKSRDAFSKQIAEKVQERNNLKAEKKEQERKFSEYLQEVRKLKAQRQADERNKRQEEYESRRRMREADKLEEQPFVAEITLVEQSIKFCNSLVAGRGVKEQEEKKEIQHTNKAEEVILLSKADREEEFYFAPLKGKKKGKTKSEKDSTSKPIKHDANTFQLFSKLKLDAPITTDDVPALLEKLEAQLEDYQNKVKDWEEKKEEMKRKILSGEVDIDNLNKAPAEEEAVVEEGGDSTDN